jgi:hypothetical protein
MDSDEFDLGTDSDDVLIGLERVEHAIGGVENAINEKWSSAKSLAWVVVLIALWDVPGNMWHSKFRYQLEYGVDSAKVVAERRPHDCNFFAAPLGEKYCHYDREVSTIYWSTSTTGNPIVSYDEGKTWSTFIPEASTKVPNADTVEQVYIGWKKAEDD